MIRAAFLALGDLLSPEFRRILLKAIGLTVLLFAVVLALVQFLLQILAQMPWPWLEWVLGLGAGVLFLAAFFFLMGPVAAVFAGLYLDQIAEKVELRHYRNDPPGRSLPGFAALVVALQFAAVVLVASLAALPAVFLGVGAAALLAINSYLLSREYFELIAMRHLPVAEARRLRKRYGVRILVAGVFPALLSLIPFISIALPLFAAAYFVHIFKDVQASSA